MARQYYTAIARLGAFQHFGFARSGLRAGAVSSEIAAHPASVCHWGHGLQYLGLRTDGANAEHRPFAVV